MRLNINSWSKYFLGAVLFYGLLALSSSYTQSFVYANEIQTTENVADGLSQTDDKNSQENSSAAASTTVTDSRETHQVIDKSQYQDKPLKVLDTSEMILDGASTLVITFSIPLDNKQNFSALLRLIDKEKGLVDGAWELSENQLELRHRYLEPNRTLILNIDKQLTGINGTPLFINYQTEITTRDRKPIVGFASQGSLLPGHNITGLPVMALNVNRVDVNFYKVKPERLYQFLQDYRNINQVTVWSSKYILSYTDLAYSGRFDLKPKVNVQESMLLDLSTIAPLQKEGFYLAVMNTAGSYNYSNPATIFSISNIGVSVHYYPNKTLSIFAQSLDTGLPLADVDIKLIGKDNYLNHLGKTDAQGFLSVDQLALDNNLILVASKDQQNSLIELGRNALDLSEFGITGSKYYAKQLFTFGPRDLYRPGETVFMNALLRDADGKPVAPQPIKAEIIKPDGQVATEFVWKPINNQSGFYQTQYIVPDNAPTGKWAFRFNVGDDNYRYAYFMVEEFLPERMAMELSPNSVLPISNKSDVIFNVKGWYLYGAPANGNELQGQVYLRPQRKVDGLNGYEIGLASDDAIARHLTEVSQSLDSEGLAQIDISRNNWQYIKSPIEIILQASLLDAGGRPVTRQVSQTVWPAATVPAVRPLFANNEFYDWSEDRYVTRPTVDKGSVAEFDIIAVNSNGERAARADLTARIIKERRDYYWTWSDSDGWQFKYNQKEFVVSEEALTLNDNKAGRVSFMTDDWGSYRLEVTDVKTKITTSMRFWSGYNWSDNTNGTGSVRPDQVKLSIDKLSYNPGDTALVHVEAPTAGNGYITVESNSGILWSKAITVPEGGIDVEIPIADWQRHDLYVSAMVVRASDSQTQKNQTIKRAVGLIYLPFNVDARRLDLTISAPERVEPSQVVPIKVKLPTEQISAGKEVTVLLSVVDSGVLNITNFATPDPFSELLGRKRYEVDQFDIYGKLIEGNGRLVGLSFGGDSDSPELATGGKRPEPKVFILAEQLKTVTLDENGEAIFEFDLPDFNGEVRLMAQVWDETRFGKSQQTMKVAAPLIVELSMPRFLSGGDKTELALDLRNLTDTEQSVTVNLTATGLVALDSDASQTITLAPAERAILPVKVSAGYGFGQGNIEVKVDGLKINQSESKTYSRNWKIGVRPAYAADLRSYTFTLKSGETWKLPSEALSGLINATVESQLVVSNKPAINAAQYIKELRAYPYGCLEQTISGLYPSLFVNSAQLIALGIESETDDVRRRNIDIGIERILGMQRSNGSFGLWSKESAEEYWLTVYAVDFLLRAQEHGYSINIKALDKAIERISAYLYDSSAFYNMNESYYADSKSYLQFAVKSYAAMVLTRHGKITPAVRNELNRLYLTARNDKEQVLKSALPMTQLAIAAKYAGYTKASDRLLAMVSDYQSHESDDVYWYGDYGSPIRDNAMIFFLLLENDLQVNKAYENLPLLANDLNAKRYLSTQELNAVFLASWQLGKQTIVDNWQIKLNDKSIDVNKSLTQAIDAKQLAQGLMLKNTGGKNMLYGRIDISGYAEKAPVETSGENVLRIERSYYDIEGNRTNIDTLRTGELVLVMLEVYSTRQIADALVVDLLPAGFELENQNLANSSVNIMSIPGIENMLSDENNYDIKYQEYRDDRYVAAININRYYGNSLYNKRLVYLARAVTPGAYVVPAPYVESMYHPAWFAIGKTPSLMEIEKTQ